MLLHGHWRAAAEPPATVTGAKINASPKIFSHFGNFMHSTGSSNKKCIVVDVGTHTTTNRHFRQHHPNILWFPIYFFLTSFAQPLILRTQTRGECESVVAFGAGPISDANGLGPTEYQLGITPTHRACEYARHGWAFLIFRFAPIACGPSLVISFPDSKFCVSHDTQGDPGQRRMGVE